jgi:hypothetical protein
MISRLMLRLHRNAIMASGTDGALTTDFGNVFFTSMISNSQPDTNSSVVPDIEVLTTVQLNREYWRSASVLSQGGEAFEMDAKR